MKCSRCKQREAVWAEQDLPGNDKLTYTFLGNHYRGFKVVKVCDECKQERQAQEQGSVLG